MILASKFMVEYDPYIEYTVNLPEYDVQTDYIEQLADTVATGNQVFWRRAFKKWFVAMAASWMQPEVVNHTALIMSGDLVGQPHPYTSPKICLRRNGQCQGQGFAGKTLRVLRNHHGRTRKYES